MNALRLWINEEETLYCRALAAGNMAAAIHHKKQLAAMRQRYGAGLRKQLQQREREQRQGGSAGTAT